MSRNIKSRHGGFSRGRSYSRRPRRGRSSASAVHSSKYINKAIDLEEQVEEPIKHSFADFSLDVRIVEQIKARNYVTPTPIQDKAIPLIMGNKDVIGIADTGTGKTAAFLLPLIHKMLKDRTQRAIIIVPTRELAAQIEEELRAFTPGMKIYSALCIGGAGFNNQLRALKRNPQFVIGTPGRLMDHLSRRTLRLNDVNNLVLDEADRMVDMGFIDDIRKLISYLPRERQSLFFSATIPVEVRGLINNFTHNPETVSVKNRETSQNVEQDIVRFVDQFQKMTLLHDILNQDDAKKVLIFGRTKHGVERLSNSLNDRGFNALSIHGNKTQAQRRRSLADFKAGKAQILVATDVAARGLDIPGVSIVINYDAPENYLDYIHRIGRTGRANTKGKALTFVGLGA